METEKNKRLLRRLQIVAYRSIAIASLMAVGIAHGAIVNYDGGTGFTTGIDGLSVGGVFYDVDFIDASYDSVYTSVTPTFFGDAAGANAAADAIMAILNAETVVPEINAFPNEVLWVAYDVSGSNFFAAQTGHDISTDPWRRFGNFSGDRGTNWGPWFFARFTEVPEPTSLALMGLGLAGLGFARRKKAA